MIRAIPEPPRGGFSVMASDALRNASRVGLCFGAKGGRGPGVRGGTFELLDFEVLP